MVIVETKETAAGDLWLLGFDILAGAAPNAAQKGLTSLSGTW